MTPSAFELTHPDRLLFPHDAITKADLASYYQRVAPLMLPHLLGRPLAIVRCPAGIAGEHFFQKHWTGPLPPGLDTVMIRQRDGRRLPHLMIRNAVGLYSLVQYNVIEIHVWGARADAIDLPDRMVFDLDPAPGVPWQDVRDAARRLHRQLGELGLEAWIKTSGGKGLHVLVPIRRGPSWDDVSGLARAMANGMAEELPKRFIATASKASRHGKIFIDWLRNVRGATSVAPWSVRARPGAPVSAPWPWRNLAALRSPDQVSMTSVRAGRADPWADLFDCNQRLTASVLRQYAR